MLIPQSRNQLTWDLSLHEQVSIFRLNGKLAEPSYFLQKNDSLFIRKPGGVSPCRSGYEAWHKIEWLENVNKFILHNISDACRRQSNSWTSMRIRSGVELLRRYVL